MAGRCRCRRTLGRLRGSRRDLLFLAESHTPSAFPPTAFDLFSAAYGCAGSFVVQGLARLGRDSSHSPLPACDQRIASPIPPRDPPPPGPPEMNNVLPASVMNSSLLCRRPILARARPRRKWHSLLLQRGVRALRLLGQQSLSPTSLQPPPQGLLPAHTTTLGANDPFRVHGLRWARARRGPHFTLRTEKDRHDEIRGGDVVRSTIPAI